MNSEHSAISCEKKLKIPLTTFSNLPPELLKKILSKLGSNHEVFEKSLVSKAWYNAINTLDVIEKIPPPGAVTSLLLKSANREQVIANPLCFLHHLEKTMTNFKKRRPTKEYVLNGIHDGEELLFVKPLDNGCLLRVSRNCFYLTYLKPNDVQQKTVVKFSSKPVKFLIRSCTNNKALLIFKDSNEPIKMIEFKITAQEKVVAIDLPPSTEDASLSLHGDYLLTLNRYDKIISFWDLSQTKIKSRPLATVSCLPTTHFWFSPNNTHLVVMEGRKLLIWDYSKGVPQPVEINYPNVSNEFRPVNVFFSLDGNQILIKHAYEKKVSLIELTSNILSPQEIIDSASVGLYTNSHFLEGNLSALHPLVFLEIMLYAHKNQLHTKFGQLVTSAKEDTLQIRSKITVRDYWPETNKFNFEQL